MVQITQRKMTLQNLFLKNFVAFATFRNLAASNSENQ